MEMCVNGVKSGVVGWVKGNARRWFDHVEKMKSGEFVKKKCMRAGLRIQYWRGMPLERWNDTVKEYMNEGDTGRGEGLEQAKRECQDREG